MRSRYTSRRRRIEIGREDNEEQEAEVVQVWR